jgi:hypothetical protein
VEHLAVGCGGSWNAPCRDAPRELLPDGGHKLGDLQWRHWRWISPALARRIRCRGYLTGSQRGCGRHDGSGEPDPDNPTEQQHLRAGHGIGLRALGCAVGPEAVPRGLDKHAVHGWERPMEYRLGLPMHTGTGIGCGISSIRGSSRWVTWADTCGERERSFWSVGDLSDGNR